MSGEALTLSQAATANPQLTECTNMDAQIAADRIRGVRASGVSYHKGLANQLKLIAGMIRGGLHPSFYASMGGFDTLRKRCPPS